MLIGNFLKNIKKEFKNHQFAGVSFNSEDCKKDYIFFAIKGIKSDGSKFIDHAIEKGATIIGLPKSGVATELRVEFADGVIDDWETVDFIAQQPVDCSPAAQESTTDDSEDEGRGKRADRDLATSPVIEDDPFAELDAIMFGVQGDAIGGEDTDVAGDAEVGDGDADPYDLLESMLSG